MVMERGSKGADVKSVQAILNFLHFQGRLGTTANADFQPLEEDGVFGPDTEDAVMQFQEDASLYVDGRVGPITIAALQAAYGSRHVELTAPLSASNRGELFLDTGPADVVTSGGTKGYNRVRLRSDVMVAYREVYDEVHRQGGLMTSSGGIRDRYFKVGPNQSATSFHYSGRALDLMIWSGMSDPATDAYVVQRLGDRRYQVHARCEAARAVAGALPASTTIENVVTYKSRTRGIAVTGHFLDLTALFETHGFKPIRARPAFERGGAALGAEWWHFQYEVGLIPGSTTFGSELRKLYSEAELIPSPPWKYRNNVFGRDWN